MALHFLIAIGQGVEVRVVEQRMVSIAPREPFRSDTQVVVFDEFRPGVVLLLVHQVYVDAAQSDRREENEEGQVLPDFVRACNYITCRLGLGNWAFKGTLGNINLLRVRGWLKGRFGHYSQPFGPKNVEIFEMQCSER